MWCWILGVASVACNALLLLLVLRLRRDNDILAAEVKELSKQLEDAIQRLAKYETELKPKSETFRRFIDLLAAAGAPALVLLGAMAISGFSGAAAITVALASLGGPAGMLGGIGFLVTLGVAMARYGITDLSIEVVRKILATTSETKLLQEIDALPKTIPQKIRAKAKSLVKVN
jgi:hypothetical protein